jgi:hypothetical protein
MKSRLDVDEIWGNRNAAPAANAPLAHPIARACLTKIAANEPDYHCVLRSPVGPRRFQ